MTLLEIIARDHINVSYLMIVSLEANNLIRYKNNYVCMILKMPILVKTKFQCLQLMNRTAIKWFAISRSKEHNNIQVKNSNKFIKT